MEDKGKKHFTRNLKGALDKKADLPNLVPGLLGAIIDRPRIAVEGRPDFVWVRLRGDQNEPIQAFNDRVALHYDLPVLVYRDPQNRGRWMVYGRDSGAYESWGGVPYLVNHGDAHSFSGRDYQGGDPVWVYKRQFMPWLPRPAATGTTAVYIEAGYYFANGVYHWWPGSGTQDLSGYAPTGGRNARFVTVYMDTETETLQYTPGEEFDPLLNQPPRVDKIPLPDQDTGIPICSVFMGSGTRYFGWGEIYDLRYAPTVNPSTGTNLIDILEDGILTGSVDSLDFGPNFDVSISGSRARITFAGGGSLTTEEPTPDASVTGATWLTSGAYTSGTLLLYINGLSQRPTIDYTETDPGAGEYDLVEPAPTGSSHQVAYQ